MQRWLRVAGWIGCGFSSLLLVGTVVLWVRSLGHVEEWRYTSFKPRPEWTTLEKSGRVNLGKLKLGGLPAFEDSDFAPDLMRLEFVRRGIWRKLNAQAIHGRLWLESWTRAPVPDILAPQTIHKRDPISADQAKHRFETYFQSGQRRYRDGTERTWRFAGAGFRESCDPVDRRSGRLHDEGFSLAVPFWMLSLVFGLWPGLVVLRRVLRRKRYGPGMCPQCGYDLRATPDAVGPRLGRCPECGREVAAARG